MDALLPEDDQSNTDWTFTSGTWRVALPSVARPVNEVGRPGDPDLCVFVDNWPDGWRVVQRPAQRWEDPVVAKLRLTRHTEAVTVKKKLMFMQQTSAVLHLSAPFELMRRRPAEPAPFLMLGWQSVDDNERLVAYRVRVMEPTRYVLDGCDDEDGPFRVFMTGGGRGYGPLKVASAAS